jgi:O-acetylhomoserine (thiol)-lyase
MNPRRIAVVVGSTSEPSRTRVLAQGLVDALDRHLPLQTQWLELQRLAPHIGITGSARELPPEGAAAVRAIETADLVLAASPVYKGSFDLFDPGRVHAGYSTTGPTATTKAVAVPLHQTVAYAFDSAQHGADLFDLKVPGNIYTRIMNPTQDVLEQRLAALEGGIAALALASGQAAVTYAILTISEAGDNIVASSALYGGTYNLFAHTLPQYGISTRFFDYRQPGQLRAADRRAHQGHLRGIAGQPAGQRDRHRAHRRDRAPPRRAADRGQHGGHALPQPAHRTWRRHRGAVADQVPGRPRHQPGRRHHRQRQVPLGAAQGTFQAPERARRQYHGVVYTEALGPAAYIGRARVVPLRNIGAAISPFNAWLILQGIETLALRMDRISDNTLAMAQHLQRTPRWAGSTTPACPSTPTMRWRRSTCRARHRAC